MLKNEIGCANILIIDASGQKMITANYVKLSMKAAGDHRGQKGRSLQCLGPCRLNMEVGWGMLPRKQIRQEYLVALRRLEDGDLNQ
ncbi:MAG: hypothetical protein EB012_10275 [Gammaproteobacteria bacterium]|nr:hypothetical protein [Gammaproteobacteria bacterium]